VGDKLGADELGDALAFLPLLFFFFSFGDLLVMGDETGLVAVDSLIVLAFLAFLTILSLLVKKMLSASSLSSSSPDRSKRLSISTTGTWIIHINKSNAMRQIAMIQIVILSLNVFCKA
jgi:hypothetical protein